MDVKTICRRGADFRFCSPFHARTAISLLRRIFIFLPARFVWNNIASDYKFIVLAFVHPRRAITYFRGERKRTELGASRFIFVVHGRASSSLRASPTLRQKNGFVRYPDDTSVKSFIIWRLAGHWWWKEDESGPVPPAMTRSIGLSHCSSERKFGDYAAEYDNGDIRMFPTNDRISQQMFVLSPVSSVARLLPLKIPLLKIHVMKFIFKTAISKKLDHQAFDRAAK